MIEPYYNEDGITIYHADCRDVLPQLERVDLVLTDPPYGIGYNAQTQNLPGSTVFADITNDRNEFDLSFLFAVNCEHFVVFGANCFPHLLPFRGRWICWDKRVDEAADKMLGSPFELAWTNRTSGFDRMYRVQHGGVVNADGYGQRFHPTQKPRRLFKKILMDKPWRNCKMVLDPFMGSGTTLRAAKDLGLKAIGIEINEAYCQIAVERLRQGTLFDAMNQVQERESLRQVSMLDSVAAIANR